MRVVIENDFGVIFEMTDSGALAPLKQDERAEAFTALTESLALLSGITLKGAFCAKEVATDEHFRATQQCHEDRVSSNVVRLTRQRGIQE